MPSISFVHPAFDEGPIFYMPPASPIRGTDDMLSSPLGQLILDYKPPRGFVIPAFSMYNGSVDPCDYMFHYNQTMILNVDNDRLLCKMFPASLRGPALTWFHKLPHNSINSFYELWGTFISQYLYSMRQKGTSALYRQFSSRKKSLFEILQ